MGPHSSAHTHVSAVNTFGNLVYFLNSIKEETAGVFFSYLLKQPEDKPL